jgi:hypothetical protein
LYLIVDRRRDVCKIGISSKPQERLSTIQTGYPWKLSLEHFEEFEDAKCIEKKLHDRFKSFRLEGEWFDIQVAELINWKNPLGEKS